MLNGVISTLFLKVSIRSMSGYFSLFHPLVIALSKARAKKERCVRNDFYQVLKGG